MAVLVGTSGWVYPSWRGDLYPPGLAQCAWLAHYAAEFSTVEANSTFYRLARPSATASWAATVPDEFRFVVKGSRYLTHVRRDPAGTRCRHRRCQSAAGGGEL